MKKKLIFITEALWIGGIETALVNLLNRLDYDRYDVTCLILRDCQEMAYRITPQSRLIGLRPTACGDISGRLPL